MLRLEQFRHIVPDERLANIYQRARGLYGKHIVHVNSTYQGGGVAEILYSLVALMNDVGIDTGWRILHGSSDFFEITKEFHNGIQGAKIKLTPEKIEEYRDVNMNFSRFTHFHHDCVIVHDPQPLALIQFYRKRQPWIWRCHIDLTDPNPSLWDFFKGFLLKYDQMVVSSEGYIKHDLPVSQRIMYPAINPLTPKNIDLDRRPAMKLFAKNEIPTDKPLITQVSRMDPWKNPEGVVDVFEHVKEKVDCRLLFCYNTAHDDPQGIEMLESVMQKARKHIEKQDILLVFGNNQTLVNAVQRYSDVVIQKSIREGFCLCVSEALWKSTPVVASNVGGIPLQIEDGREGFLLEPTDVKGFADRIVHLLKNPKAKKEMGRKAKIKVRDQFLITRLLSDYLDMLNSILNGKDNHFGNNNAF